MYRTSHYWNLLIVVLFGYLSIFLFFGTLVGLINYFLEKHSIFKKIKNFNWVHFSAQIILFTLITTLLCLLLKHTKEKMGYFIWLIIPLVTMIDLAIDFLIPFSDLKQIRTIKIATSVFITLLLYMFELLPARRWYEDIEHFDKVFKRYSATKDEKAIFDSFPPELKKELLQIPVGPSVLAYILGSWACIDDEYHPYISDLDDEAGISLVAVKYQDQVNKIIQKWNETHLPDVKSKKAMLVCHSKYHKSKLFLLSHKPSNKLEDYVTLDPHGLGPKDFAMRNIDIKKYFPKEHYNYLAAIYCPQIHEFLEKLLDHVMADGSIFEIAGVNQIQQIKSKKLNFELIGGDEFDEFVYKITFKKK